MVANPIDTRAFRAIHFVVGATLLAYTVSFAVGCSTNNKLASLFSEALPAGEASAPLGWNTSYAEATTEANSTGKVRMLWFTGSDWCKYCTMLENEVFHTAAFQEWSAENIVPVMLDYPKRTKLPADLHEQNAALDKKYKSHVTSYPTALFLDQRGNVVGKLGYYEGGPKPWIAKAKSIVAKAGVGVANNSTAQTEIR